MLGSLPGRGAGGLLVGLEGTAEEVSWMADTLLNEWRKSGTSGEIVSKHQTDGLWMRLAQFPAAENAPLVIQAALRPSRTVEFIKLLERIDPDCSIQSHAGNGIVVARMTQFGDAGLSNMLVGLLAADRGRTWRAHNRALLWFACRAHSPVLVGDDWRRDWNNGTNQTAIRSERPAQPRPIRIRWTVK